jgi:hypothetical protein
MGVALPFELRRRVPLSVVIVSQILELLPSRSSLTYKGICEQKAENPNPNPLFPSIQTLFDLLSIRAVERHLHNENRSKVHPENQTPIPFVFFVSFCSNPLQTFCRSEPIERRLHNGNQSPPIRKTNPKSPLCSLCFLLFKSSSNLL